MSSNPVKRLLIPHGHQHLPKGFHRDDYWKPFVLTFFFGCCTISFTREFIVSVDIVSLYFWVPCMQTTCWEWATLTFPGFSEGHVLIRLKKKNPSPIFSGWGILVFRFMNYWSEHLTFVSLFSFHHNMKVLSRLPSQSSLQVDRETVSPLCWQQGCVSWSGSLKSCKVK